MNIKRLMTSISGGFALAAVVPALAFAATPSLVVDSNGDEGFAFNRDTTTTTPYEFTQDKSSIGSGSLYVKPIGSNPSDKFIAEKTLNVTKENFNSISYDFQIAGDGTATDASKFYLNVYTTLPGSSSTFYDCRFDFEPTNGSTSGFTTFTVDANTVATNVDDRFDGDPRPDDGVACPTTLAGLPDGSTIRFFSISVGDTTATDEGLAGYLDKVVVNLATGITTYDFEKEPTVVKPVKATDKDQCKNNGYNNFVGNNDAVFKNQGDCVSFVASNGKAKGNPEQNTSVVTTVRNALARLF